jgi:hypothetical protein
MDLMRPLLMYGVLPLWMLAGVADWACHRRTCIESTGGLRESAFHWVMFSQMGVAALAVLFLELNAAVLLLAGALFLAHEVTTWMELRFVVGRREVSPIEQMIHSFMEILPLAGLFLLLGLYADRRNPAGASDWSLRLKDEPLPAAYLLAALAGAMLLNVLPLAEESWRCWRGRQGAGGARRLPH